MIFDRRGSNSSTVEAADKHHQHKHLAAKPKQPRLFSWTNMTRSPRKNSSKRPARGVTWSETPPPSTLASLDGTARPTKMIPPKQTDFVVSNIDSAAGRSNNNKAVKWLSKECPQEIVPSILAFAGPQSVMALSRTSKSWRAVVRKESTWKVMCHALGKWKEGDKVPATTWKRHYCCNPLVPDDFPTVEQALYSAKTAACGSGSIRILCRPGTHSLISVITLSDPNVQVTIETSNHRPLSSLRSPIATLVKHKDYCYQSEPAIRVFSGVNLSLTNLGLVHHSFGTNNGLSNAAIHIIGDGNASLSLHGVELTSTSGHGVVAIADDTKLLVVDSHVHSCAGSGIYLAGDPSSLIMDHCDVVKNGTGNRPMSVDVDRSSGIFVKGGTANLTDCNISDNSAAGITLRSSSSSPTSGGTGVAESTLTMKRTEVLSNGTEPMTLPSDRSPAFIDDGQNRAARTGTYSIPRSSLLLAKKAAYDDWLEYSRHI